MRGMGERESRVRVLVLIELYSLLNNWLIWVLIGLRLLTKVGLYNVSALENRGINRGGHLIADRLG